MRNVLKKMGRMGAAVLALVVAAGACQASVIINLSLGVDTGAKTWKAYATISDPLSQTLGLHGMYINVWGSETMAGPWSGPLDITTRTRKLPKGATETDDMDVGFATLAVSGAKVGTGYKQFGSLQSNTYEKDSDNYTNILLGVGEAAGHHQIGATDFIDYTNPVLVASGAYTGTVGWINVSALNPDTGFVDLTLLPASLPPLGNDFNSFSPAASDVHGASVYIPEPASLALLGLGGLGLLLRRKRR